MYDELCNQIEEEPQSFKPTHLDQFYQIQQDQLQYQIDNQMQDNLLQFDHKPILSTIPVLSQLIDQVELQNGYQPYDNIQNNTNQKLDVENQFVQKTLDNNLILTDQQFPSSEQKEQQQELKHKRKNHYSKDKKDKSSLSFISELNACHYCRVRDIPVYRCFKKHVPTSCIKHFCRRCLKEHFGQDIDEEIKKTEGNWFCPFKRGVCKCNKCSYRFEQQDHADSEYLDVDAIQLGSTLKNEEQKNAFQKVLRFNAALIQEIETQQKLNTISQDEMDFYNAILYSSLQNSLRISDYVVEHDLQLKTQIQ